MGPPGIGCPVVSSLSGASFVVLVTEPTVSGLHDLKRVYELVKKFSIKAGCIINKADLNINMLERIRTFLSEEKIDLLAEIPYDEKFTSAMTNAENSCRIRREIRENTQRKLGKNKEYCRNTKELT